ncbi:hypothetical protein DYY67_1644 [Candidatus Nitrosotalea sp. TS]|nr:hypothetical protein [Candidatus Nitrosotalea sp. TS]NHI03332.1 hypothetical protein [Candidatus Nitrosotalea sp. TS]
MNSICFEDRKNLPDVDVIVVPMVLARDGIRISTSRIKRCRD